MNEYFGNTTNLSVANAPTPSPYALGDDEWAMPARFSAESGMPGRDLTSKKQYSFRNMALSTKTVTLLSFHDC